MERFLVYWNASIYIGSAIGFELLPANVIGKCITVGGVRREASAPDSHTYVDKVKIDEGQYLPEKETRFFPVGREVRQSEGKEN